MTFTISFGWWVAPVVVTAISFLVAYASSEREQAFGLGAVGQAMANGFLFLIAIVVSLSAWLVWSIFA